MSLRGSKIVRLTVIIASVLFGAMQEMAAQAAQYYVSSSIGKDAYPPTRARRPDTPWRTIQRALDYVRAGDTIIVLPGVYNEHAQVKSSGTADRPISLVSRIYGRARVQGSISGIGVAHIRVSGFDVTNRILDPDHPPTLFDPKGIYFYYAHHIEISTNIVHDCRGGGIGLVNTDEVLVRDNIVQSNAAGFDGSHSGISVYQPLNFMGEHGDGPGTIICRNLCFNNSNTQYYDEDGNPKEMTDGHGIIVDDTMATQREAFVSNLEYFWSVAPNAASMPIDWESPYTRTILIDSNVCHSNGGSGISLFICENVTVCNNTCLLNQRNLFDVAEVNLGGTSNALIQNNVMISPLRQTNDANNAVALAPDLRQAAKLSDNVMVNDPETIQWISNALYDSETIEFGLSDMHDANSLALDAPVVMAVNPITGAINLHLADQLRDRGAPVVSSMVCDFRSSPRIQGTAIDIGAVEAFDPPLEFPTVEAELEFELQLELQRLRETQLPRFKIR